MKTQTPHDLQGTLKSICTAVTPRELGGLLALYVLGVAAMYLLLAAACLIPNAWLQSNVQESLATVQSEDWGEFTPVFAYGQSDKLNLYTDNLILETLLTDPDQTVFEQAVEGGHATRYWQGYKVLLRPLYCLFTYVDIRTLMMFVLSGQVLLCLLRVRDRFGTAEAAAFGAALTMGHLLIIPWMMEYFVMFSLALAVMAWLLRHYRPTGTTAGQLACLCLCTGMLAQYLDFFTVPLLTLCLPLSVVLLADMREDALDTAARWSHFLWPCAAWAFGWLFGWAAKWPLSDLILRRDESSHALHQIAMRSAGGTEEYHPGMLAALARNVFCFLPMNQLHAHGSDRLLVVFAALFAAALLGLVLYAVRRRPPRDRVLRAAPAFVCAALPYLWFMVLAGHTWEHYIFTYRTQVASAFLLLGTWAYLCGISGPSPAARQTEGG